MIHWTPHPKSNDNLHVAEAAGYTLQAWESGEWLVAHGCTVIVSWKHQVKAENLRAAQLRAQAALLSILTPGEIKSLN